MHVVEVRQLHEWTEAAASNRSRCPGCRRRVGDHALAGPERRLQMLETGGLEAPCELVVRRKPSDAALGDRHAERFEVLPRSAVDVRRGKLGEANLDVALYDAALLHGAGVERSADLSMQRQRHRQRQKGAEPQPQRNTPYAPVARQQPAERHGLLRRVRAVSATRSLDGVAEAAGSRPTLRRSIDDRIRRLALGSTLGPSGGVSEQQPLTAMGVRDRLRRAWCRNRARPGQRARANSGCERSRATVPHHAPLDAHRGRCPKLVSAGACKERSFPSGRRRRALYDDPELLKVGNPHLRPQFTESRGHHASVPRAAPLLRASHGGRHRGRQAQ